MAGSVRDIIVEALCRATLANRRQEREATSLKMRIPDSAGFCVNTRTTT